MRKRVTPTKVKKTPQERNPNGHYESICKYHTQDIYDEVAVMVDIDDYDSIINWAIKQPYSKVKFCASKCGDLPTIVKLLCASLVADTKVGRTTSIQMALDRVVGRPIERQQIDVIDSTPKLTINVSSDIVQDNLDKLLGGPDNANNEDVR